MNPTQSPTNPHAAGKAAQPMTTATKQGHTPGPWEASELSVNQPRPGRAPMHVASLSFSAEPQRVCQANARLIAAAPELLEALQQAKRVLLNMPGTFTCLDAVCAAIRKATGGDQ